MKKRFLLIGLIPLVLLFGCVAPKSDLGDLQVAACDSAHKNGNCGRLDDVGLVSASQCCSSLLKCCSTPTGRVVNPSQPSQFPMSDLEIAACESASSNDRCSQLSDLSIVTHDDCCSYLGLCCFGSISIEDFKAVLIDAIKSYFSNNPILSTNEVKDLITPYFSSKGDTVDLSGIGSYSGKKLIDTYNKAKGTGSFTCSDSDGGKDYYLKGLTCVPYPQTYGMGTHCYYDVCTTDGHVTEYFCTQNDLGQQSYPCHSGCSDGACLPGNQTQTCTDSDGGEDYYKYGWAVIPQGGYASDQCSYETGNCSGSLCSVESCSGVNCYVLEAVCERNSVTHNKYFCPNGCSDGVCVSSPNLSCNNECSQAGVHDCPTSTSYRVCGHFDQDTCLEWSQAFNCGGGPCSGCVSGGTTTYSILEKKSLYKVGDQIHSVWSLPSYAYEDSACTVHFITTNSGVDHDFYVVCGDPGLDANSDLGTLSTDHCYGKSTVTTNSVRIAITNSQGSTVVQSPSDTYTIDCSSGQTNVVIPPNTKEYDAVEDWYVPYLQSGLGFSCYDPVEYVVINVSRSNFTRMAIHLGGWSHARDSTGSPYLIDVYSLKTKLVYVPTGKVMFDSDDGMHMNLITPEYNTKVCVPTGIACQVNVDNIPAGKYLLSVTYAPRDADLCQPGSDYLNTKFGLLFYTK